jgi:hypothetical protein
VHVGVAGVPQSGQDHRLESTERAGSQPDRPDLEWCTDGAGYPSGIDTCPARALNGNPYNMNTVKIQSWSGDDCGIWDAFGPASLFNAPSLQRQAGWHWQARSSVAQTTDKTTGNPCDRTVHQERPVRLDLEH